MGCECAQVLQVLDTDETTSRTPTGRVMPMLLKLLSDSAVNVRVEAAAALANAAVSGKQGRQRLLRYSRGSLVQILS